jgi:phosphoribosylamine--glycine ligase
MNILILGSGGREHALAWKILQSPKCTNLFVAPGNAGTAQIATNINIETTDFENLTQFILSHRIQLVIVGPEVPLVKGVVDYFKKNPALKELMVIGPDKKAAALEGSKDFSKQFMKKYGIPTASSRTFTKKSLEEGLHYLDTHSLPVVLKADGLAAGKGVIIASSIPYAKEVLFEMLAEDKFGEASAKVVIEQYLDGIELSVFVITDGENYKLLPEAKDYKRIGEGDTGPNTGGMGAISPVPFADQAFLDTVEATIIKPTIEGLKNENINYTGFIFFGLMNVAGKPYVIEYNARLGDPETEVIIPRIKNDLVDLFIATAQNRLQDISIEVASETTTTVMLVAGGYPDSYEKGKEITGFEHLSEVIAFHAGTKLSDGKIVTNGGRVIAVTAMGSSIENALKKANEGASKLQWENKLYRKDIGFDLMHYSQILNKS